MARSIKHCPFCSSAHSQINHHQLAFYVVCQHCLGAGPRRRSIDDAINEWNLLATRLEAARFKGLQAAALQEILNRLNRLETVIAPEDSSVENLAGESYPLETMGS